MDEKVVNAMVAATQNIFQTMMSLDAAHGKPAEEPVDAGLYDFTGIIQLDEGRAGVVGVHVPKKVAAKVASSLLGMEVDENAAEAAEMVAELTNMIAGGVKNHLDKEGVSFEISLPTVAATDKTPTHTLQTAPNRVSVPFHVGDAIFVVEMSLTRTIPSA